MMYNISHTLSEMLPDHLTWSIARIGTVFDLTPSEAAIISGASKRRVSEFSAGRWCAHRALGRLGSREVEVLREATFAPRWPTGFLGSITHDEDIAMAIGYAVRPRCTIFYGIDLVYIPRNWNLLEFRHVIFAEREISRWNTRQTCNVTVAGAFAAKEVAIKAWSQVDGRVPDFLDLVVERIRGAHWRVHSNTSRNVVSASVRTVGAYLLCVGTLVIK